MHTRFVLAILRLTTISIFGIGNANSATLTVDQVGANFHSGGYGGPVVQTFMPGQDNIAGVDVLISGTAAVTATVSVSLYSDLALTNLLAADTIVDHLRSTDAAFRWDAVAVVPDRTYYFEFTTGLLAIGAGISNTTDPYDRGNIIQGGGNLGFLYEDAVFSTYYDADFSPVPVPAAAWLFGSAVGFLGWTRRKESA